jgi:hypothetical protein
MLMPVFFKFVFASHLWNTEARCGLPVETNKQKKTGMYKQTPALVYVQRMWTACVQVLVFLDLFFLCVSLSLAVCDGAALPFATSSLCFLV